MGTSMAEMTGEVRDVVESTQQFLDEIDREALSEAALARKPEIDRIPHSFVHEGIHYISQDGKYWKAPLWGEK